MLGRKKNAIPLSSLFDGAGFLVYPAPQHDAMQKRK
jgi:hypothetical protein